MTELPVSERIFFVFPGQGSQYRGMGEDLVAEFASARDLYRRASEIVGYDMLDLSTKDPREELNRTRFTQPALLTHQVAALSAFRELTGERVKPKIAGGHSLGEYTALVAAGALTFERALQLVARRGELMSELGRGGMLATTLELAEATALAEKHYCGIGGANLPDQTVIAGEDKDLDALVADMAAVFPGKRGVRLNTEGAFHTYLMVSAAQQFREVLERTPFEAPVIDVLSNFTGKLHEPAAGAIRSRLFFQLFNPVRWVGCMSTAIDAGIDTIVELGGGIGKGEGAQNKRPNLETIVKKSLKWREREARYLPAINVGTIRAAAQQLLEG
jgi:[acyl-carrier-protein] S-malonyltransferase